MSLEDDIAFFEQVPTLAALGRQALRVLAVGAETRHLPSGAVLFYSGEPADGGYIVFEGELLLKPAKGLFPHKNSGSFSCMFTLPPSDAPMAAPEVPVAT